MCATPLCSISILFSYVMNSNFLIACFSGEECRASSRINCWTTLGYDVKKIKVVIKCGCLHCAQDLAVPTGDTTSLKFLPFLKERGGNIDFFRITSYADYRDKILKNLPLHLICPPKWNESNFFDAMICDTAD